MKKLPRKIVVIRLSAMGDVAMTVPVISSLVNQHQVEVLMLTNKAFEPMFHGIPNVRCISIDKKGRHKGLVGLYRLFLELKKLQPDAVADLHDVIRSRILRLLFLINNVKTVTIDKGRSEKRNLVKKGKNESLPLKHSVERYKEVFQALGFQFELNFQSLFTTTPQLSPVFLKYFGKKKEKWVGIAPFAKHKGKMYPFEKMSEVIGLLDKQGIKIMLFGKGAHEMQLINEWHQKFTSVNSMPTNVHLLEELQLMAYLDVMLSMDSANMHLASLVGLPAVSIWGATHYYAGFLGWNQSVEAIVEADLPCRPCSVYGNKPCKRKDYACLNNISPQQIVDKINLILDR